MQLKPANTAAKRATSQGTVAKVWRLAAVSVDFSCTHRNTLAVQGRRCISKALCEIAGREALVGARGEERRGAGSTERNRRESKIELPPTPP